MSTPQTQQPPQPQPQKTELQSQSQPQKEPRGAFAVKAGWEQGGLVGALKAVGQELIKDGALAAAWRQGAKELGEALKAFPDSIQVLELGTVFTPTPGEISKGRDIGLDHEQERSAPLFDRAKALGAQLRQAEQSLDHHRGHEHDQSHGR
jgi:hypothetical protein